MGIWMKCPSCGEECEHDILTYDEDENIEKMMLGCQNCGHTWFGTFARNKTEGNTKCPECGTGLEYDSAIYDHDEGACLLADCPNCGAEVKEVYAMVYKRSEVYGHIPKAKDD